jgi:oligosaccharide reducing-end xylanase
MISLFNKAKTITVLALSAGVAFAAPTIEVGTWGNFCKGALSFTFDDYPTSGATQIATTGRAAFDAKKFHMTMFVTTTGQTTNSWKDLNTCFANGHEVGSHNYNHDASADNLQKSQTTTKQNVPGEMCISFAYPNGTNIAAAANIFVVARDAGGSLNSKTPSSFAHIGCTGFGAGAGNYKNDASSMNSFAESAATGGGWAVEMHHGIGSDSHSWATTNLDEMKKHLEYLDTKRSTIWVETFGNVARYIKERDAAKATVTSSDDKTVKLTVTTTTNLDKTIFNYPLSLRCELPSGWTDPTVSQGGKAMKDTIVTVGSTKYLMFQAVPDGSEIILSATTTSVKEQRKILETGKMVLIDNTILTINSLLFSGSNISVSLFDLRGKIIAKYTLNNSESSIALPSKNLRNEAFLVKVSDGRKTYTEKLTPQL